MQGETPAELLVDGRRLDLLYSHAIDDEGRRRVIMVPRGEMVALRLDWSTPCHWRRRRYALGIVPTHAGASMRRSSSRALTAAALVAGLVVLVVAGRLLPTAPSTQPPPTSTATTPVSTAPPTSQAVQARVPDAIGQPLAQAKAAMREAGLQGVPRGGDPQGPAAVVVVQEPAAGELVDAGSVIGFRTSADIVANGTARRVRLGLGLGLDQGWAAYLVVAPDPTRHELTVVVAMPGAADVVVMLQPGPGQRPLVVLSGVWDAAACPLTGGQIRCVVRFGTLEAAAPGVWIASVAKRSPVPAEVTVTVTFRPL